MQSEKKKDRVCILIIILISLLAIVFLYNTGCKGIQLGYEDRLFDKSKVHQINIEMDNWEDFISRSGDEQYEVCNIQIDGEVINKVGLRAKGYTSLNLVKLLNSKRYSFKIEFDHYNDGQTYYGLDKMCLNNLIQDNTCMKDYIAYTIMGKFGVPSPLCSYVYMTVNGEDWGLYLGVEGIEESFLERNYGRVDGELYKPDDAEDEVIKLKTFDVNTFIEVMRGDDEELKKLYKENVPMGLTEERLRKEVKEAGGYDIDLSDIDFLHRSLGTEAVKLQYITDNPEDYKAIFNNTKLLLTKADKERLIRSLKCIQSLDNIEDYIDKEEVMRYLVAHNYLVNYDSYTGVILHNYYLYERGGVLRIFPWDYNVAFGLPVFAETGKDEDRMEVISDTDKAINYPILDRLEDRPLQSWIFSDEKYINEYKGYYWELLDTIDIGELVEDADRLIRKYIEKDPTKFCTLEEYDKAIETLYKFYDYRDSSIAGQLRSLIPSTMKRQNEQPGLIILSEGIDILDMGVRSPDIRLAIKEGREEEFMKQHRDFKVRKVEVEKPITRDSHTGKLNEEPDIEKSKEQLYIGLVIYLIGIIIIIKRRNTRI